MTKDLKYKFVRTHNTSFFNSGTNFLCKDGYVHIRLGRFGDKKQKVSGFEQKLTFLITYLINEVASGHFSTLEIQKSLDSSTYEEFFNKCLEILRGHFMYKDILYTIGEIFLNFKGIKILPYYSLKHKPKSAFDLLGSCSLVESDMNICDIFDLDIKEDLYGFLFDDNFEIYIEEQTKIDESKYINKYKEKEDYIDLWK